MPYIWLAFEIGDCRALPDTIRAGINKKNIACVQRAH
jgi:hypothetical protein